MDYYAAVAGQPAALERSAASVRAGLADLDLAPWRRGTFAVVSMGAGAHAGHALAHRLALAGRRALNLTASELVAVAPAVGPADGYLFVSEGGRSRETIEAAGLVPAGARLGLTNIPDAPLSRAVDGVVLLDAGEDSRVYTVGYTATLQAFGLLADALEGSLNGRDGGEDWKRLPELAAGVLDRLGPAAAEVAGTLARASSIDVVAGPGGYATAAEAALLLRESTRIATATYETYQYLHGPMESLTPAHACLVFGHEREVKLARFLAGAGVPTVLVTSATIEAAVEAAVELGPGLTVLAVPKAPVISRAVLEILPAQLLAGEMARLRGLRIDGFLYHQDDTKVGERA